MLISFFIKQSNKESKNPHPLANYHLIRDLSKRLLKQEFETDLKKWKDLSVEKINKAVLQQLKKNTRQLRKQGRSVISLF